MAHRNYLVSCVVILLLVMTYLSPFSVSIQHKPNQKGSECRIVSPAVNEGAKGLDSGVIKSSSSEYKRSVMADDYFKMVTLFCDFALGYSSGGWFFAS